MTVLVRVINDGAQELRLAARRLRKNPGFTAAAVLTLALGIGATTAVYSALDAVLLQPLPIRDSERVVLIRQEQRETGSEIPFSLADLRALEVRGRPFEGVGAVQYDGPGAFPVVADGQPVDILGSIVSTSFFAALGVRPAVGRLPAEADGAPGAEPVIVIAHSLWRSRFGGVEDVTERSIAIGDSYRARIVGVAPPGFEFPNGSQIWLPVNSAYDGAAFSLVGRMEPNTSVQQALDETATFLAEREAVSLPGAPRGRRASVVPFHDAAVGDARVVVVGLFGSVLLVFALAGVNVLSLVLVRAGARKHELALRAALGASTRRVLRQLFAEGLMLSALGCAMGILAGWWMLRALVALAPADVPRLDQVVFDGTAFGLAASVSLVMAVVFTLIPARTGSTSDLASTLRSVGRAGSSTRRTSHGARILIGLQVAFALVVLGSAVVFAKSLVRLEGAELGFGSERLVYAHVPLVGAEYQQGRGRAQATFFAAVATRLEGIPGIDAATPVLTTPFGGDDAWTAFYTAEGQSRAETTSADLQAVLPDYFRVFAIPIVRGRPIGEEDIEGSLPVVVVSEDLAAREWPDQDPLGKRIKRGAEDAGSPWLTVVGIVRTTRYRDLVAPLPTMYVAMRQMDIPARHIAVRGTADETTIVAAVRQAVSEVDPGERVYAFESMRSLLGAQYARPRFLTFVLGGFAVTALLLALVGVYGLVSSFVSQRLHDLGVRRALGATDQHLYRLVFAHAALPTTVGLALGLILALSGMRIVRALLFEVSPADPWALVGAGVVLVTTSIAACILPIRRAIRVDPRRVLAGD